MKKLSLVPPSPEVTSYLVNEYHKKWKKLGLTFQQFLVVSGYQNPAHDIEGMDDNVSGIINNEEIDLITVPQTPITGDLEVIVLLVDFPDLPGVLPKEHYEDLLFSQGTYPTGSMADYYYEVSKEKVSIKGSVHGWFRLPKSYIYYTNGFSGLTDQFNREYYPRDARRLAEDAVIAALEHGVNFLPSLDAFSNGTVTSLFIVHAGRGAEKLLPPLRDNHIWSHKWNMKQPQRVATDLWAVTYLMVPQEALLGVCAHELGHLAFQWQDFYDPNYAEDGDHWDGNGIWDLMASGSYAGDEVRPIHPACLHKSQHGWVEIEEISSSRRNIILKPISDPAGKMIKVRSSRYQSDQFLLLENRAKQYFDSALPGEGLLIWQVDLSKEMEGSRQPGMILIQADGQHDLLNPDDRNNGDPGDPFPGSKQVVQLLDSGAISTSFPGGPASGILLKNIQHDSATKVISLDIEVQP
jgi:immune inhibitor A